MLSVEIIEGVLIDQDPEGLINMGAPSDEYTWEAEKIHNRIITENRINLIDYTSAVVFSFYETFGSFSSEDGGFEFDNDYLTSTRIKKFKTIGQIIFEMDQ